MIEFKSPTPADRSWVMPLVEASGAMGSESNFNNMYLWHRLYGQRLARLGDRLLVRAGNEQGHRYLFPYGSGPLAPALEALAEDAAALGEKLNFICLSKEQKEQLEEVWPGRFEYDCEWDRDSWDYLYDVNKLADLAGKKLHSKRNHIHRFDEQFPDWMAEPITADNVADCVAMEKEWAAARDHDSTLSEETISILEALYLRDELELHGVLIRAGGRVVAFSMGSFTNPECFDVHYEKAFGEIQGAYAVVNREMARMIRSRFPQVKWFNREDDLGLEGLRKAKLSYYPELLLEKCSAREK